MVGPVALAFPAQALVVGVALAREERRRQDYPVPLGKGDVLVGVYVSIPGDPVDGDEVRASLPGRRGDAEDNLEGNG